MSFLTKSSKTSVSGNKRSSPKNNLAFPLLLPLCSFVLGLLSVRYVNNLTISSNIFIIFALIFIILVKIKKNLIIRYYIILFLIMCLGNIYALMSLRKASNHLSQILKVKSSFIQDIEGLIISESSNYNELSYYNLRLLKISDFNCKGLLRLKAYNDSLQIGDYVKLKVRIEGYQESNPFDKLHIDRLQRAGIDAQAISLSKIAIIKKDSCNVKERLHIKWLKCFTYLKKVLYQRVNLKFPKYPTIIRSFLSGDKSSFLYDFEGDPLISYAHYQRAGILHLLAVSGMHVSLIYFCIFTLLSTINRTFARIISIIILLIFMGLCNFSPSVLRASIMLIIYLISKIIQRNQSFWQICSFSLIIILLIDPNQIYDIGLILSLTAVIAVYYSRLILTLFIRSKQIITICFIPFSTLLISIFTFPIMTYYFNQINLNALLSNLIMIPLFSMIMPTILLILILPGNLFIYQYLNKSLDLLIYLFEKSLIFFSNYRFIYYTYINNLQFICSLLFLIIMLLIFNLKKTRNKLILISLEILIVIIILVFHDKKDNYSEVIFFNTGTSDAMLIRSIYGETIIIDTGDLINFKAQVENSLIPYCLKKSIKHIDYLINTHPHADHIGGLKAISDKIKIKTLILSDENLKDSLYLKIKDRISIEKLIIIHDTLRIALKGSEMLFLHPDKNYMPDNVNNSSIVLKWSENSYNFLFTGDIDSKVEDYLLKKYPDLLESEFLKVAHHGSKTGSSESFLEAVDAYAGIITCAKRNRFNFPHKQTTTRLQRAGTKYFICGNDGAVSIKLIDGQAELYTYKSKQHYLINSKD